MSEQEDRQCCCHYKSVCITEPRSRLLINCILTVFDWSLVNQSGTVLLIIESFDVHVSQKSANGACWSPFIETLLASVNEDSLYIWDIARNSCVDMFILSKFKWIDWLLHSVSMLIYYNQNKWSKNFDERPHRPRMCHPRRWIHFETALSPLSLRTRLQPRAVAFAAYTV